MIIKEWSELKKMYQAYGSEFRNICSYNLNLDNWKDLIEILNKTYQLEFLSYHNRHIENRISFDKLIDYWRGLTEDGYMAKIKINQISFNCFFNVPDELEFDLSVFEIDKLEDHYIVLDFMKTISKALGQVVFLEEDSYSKDNKILIEVNQEYVNYSF